MRTMRTNRNSVENAVGMKGGDQHQRQTWNGRKKVRRKKRWERKTKKKKRPGRGRWDRMAQFLD